MSLEITDIKVFPTKSEKVFAFASVTFNGKLVCKGFRVMPGKDGPWVAWPSEKGKDGKYYDTVYIADRDEKNTASSKVLEKYTLTTGCVGGAQDDGWN